MSVWNQTKKLQIASHCIVANSLVSRMKGLLGEKSFAKDQALLIPDCSFVHTFFMNFPIDLVFLNQKNKAVCIFESVGAFKFRGSLEADCVLEFYSQEISQKVSLGDEIHVGC